MNARQGHRRRSDRLRWLVVILVLVAGWRAQGTGAADHQSRPSRIVSLVPAVTEMLFALGAGAQVAGVSSYDHFPPEVQSKPKVGALIDPDFERILSLKSDLVIVYGTQADLIARLDRAHVPMFHYEHAGLPDIQRTIRLLGDRIGRPAEAERLSGEIGRQLADVARQVAGRPPPRTALIFGRELGQLRGIYASGGVGFMHDMLLAAGGADVFDDIKRQSLQATSETLLARAPDVIIEVYPTGTFTPAQVVQEQNVWRTLAGLPAVRNGRIHLVMDDRLSIPGPRVGEAVRVLAKVLHPEAFPK